MLRFEVSEVGERALPVIDLDEPRLVIGSAPSARLRLPAEVARDEHVVISGGRWVALASLEVDGTARAAGDAAPIGEGVVFGFGRFRVAVRPSPADGVATPPQRTESLARELVRGLLGAGAAPTFEVERGPGSGTRRALPPPVASLVIGRGDEATWVILDEDLSRAHVEVHRGWDGVTIRDLESKNGTRVDGVAVTGATPLHDGATVELGNVALRFHDPAERHLLGSGPRRAPKPAAIEATGSLGAPAVARSRPSAWPLAIATTIAVAAVAGLIWIVAS